MAQIDKPVRVLIINDYLLEGKSVNLNSLARMFDVSKRTVQRDMDEIKAYYADKVTLDGTYQYVYYDYVDRGYKLS